MEKRETEALRDGAAGGSLAQGCSRTAWWQWFVFVLPGKKFSEGSSQFPEGLFVKCKYCVKKSRVPFLHLDKYWLAMESITALFKPYENSGVTRNKKLNVSLRSDLLQNFRHI